MTLTDANPLVAILDADDQHHGPSMAAARALPPGPLATTWPCFTEAMYLLGEAGGHGYQQRLWDNRRLGRIVLLDLTPAEADRADALMAKYHDLPMDLGDASLVAVAEARGLRRVFTLDKDFFVYRLADGSALEVVR